MERLETEKLDFGSNEKILESGMVGMVKCNPGTSDWKVNRPLGSHNFFLTIYLNGK